MWHEVATRGVHGVGSISRKVFLAHELSYCFRATVDMKLVVNPPNVIPYCVDGDVHFCRNRSVGIAVCEASENLRFLG